MCVTRCLNPFNHFVAGVEDLPCGHQVETYACGCRCNDHEHEECDGIPVADLEESK